MSGTPPSASSPTSSSSAVSAGASPPSFAPPSSVDSVDYKWYLASSTPSYVVQSFVKHLQPRSLRARQKEYVTAFARYYFNHKPTLAAADLALLLYGDGERKGLIEACGVLKGLGGTGELRGSAVLSLELLLMLVDCSVNVAHGEEVLDVLVKGGGAHPPLSGRLAASMRLERHLLPSSSSRNFALKLAFILSESCPQLQGKEWIGSAEAVRAFDEWQRVQEAAQTEAAAAAAAEDDDRELTSWAQVKLDDLDAEDVQVDAALAELIAEVDAEGEKEGGQKDPLGIARSLPSTQSLAQRGQVVTSARMGKAAAKKMQILWKQMTLTTTTPAAAAHAATTQPATAQPAAPPSTSDSATLPSPSSSAAVGGGAASLNLMQEVLLQGSTSTDRDDFNPTLFLSQVHSSSSLDALQRGLAHLQRSVNNRAAAMRSLVAEHFGQYVFCLDTIDHLHQLMQSEVTDKTSRALRIGASLAQLNQQCEEAYGGLIAAKRGSDRMRDTLRTLDSYHFLFTLPHDIQQHAQHKRYSQVVRLYNKAKQIIITAPHSATSAAPAAAGSTSTTAMQQPGMAGGDTDAALSTQPGTARKARDGGRMGDGHAHSITASATSAPSATAVDLPSLVLREAFLRVSEVRASLFRQLEMVDVALAEQVQAIQLLIDLDCDIDPAWYFLHTQRSHIAREMDAVAHAALERSQRRHYSGGEEEGGSDSQPLSQPHALSHALLAPPSPPASSSMRGLQAPNSSSSSSLSSLLISPWNPFGSLLALNPAVFPLALSQSSWSASASPPSSAGSLSLAASTAASTSSASVPSFPLASPPSFDGATGSAVHHLIHRLCGLLQHSIPPFIRLAQLIATRQLTTSAATVASGPSTSPAPSLQGVSVEHRQAIHSLLDGLFHHFSAYIRLALFPLTPQTLHTWQTQHPTAQPSSERTGAEEHLQVPEANGSAASAVPQAARAPSSAARATPLSQSASPLTGLLSTAPSAAASPSVDKSSEHSAFDADAPPSASSSLPLIPPPSTASSSSTLPLPPSMWQNVHLLLRFYHSMQELGLSADSLHQLSATRSAVVRWYAAHHLAAAKLSIEQLHALEDYAVAPQQHSTRGRGRRRGAAAWSGSAASTASSSIRCTSLPFRFLGLLQSALTSLTAVSSVKANWVVKLIAAPAMDCMKAFASTTHRLLTDALDLTEASGAEDVREEPEEEEGRTEAVAETDGRPRASVRLLLLLSNLRYTRSALLPVLLTQLLGLFPPSIHAVLMDAFDRSVLPMYAELDGALVQHFLRLHLLTLHRQILSTAYNRTALLSHLHSRAVGGKEGERPRSAVRGVIVDVLLQVVHIHSDLFHLCPPLIPQCCTTLFAGIVQSIAYCSQHIQHSPPTVQANAPASSRHRSEGADGGEAESSASFWREHPQLLQLALLELEWIERTLEAFASDDTDEALDVATHALTSHDKDSQEQQTSDALQREGRSQQLARDIAATSSMFYCLSLPQQQHTQQPHTNAKEDALAVQGGEHGGKSKGRGASGAGTAAAAQRATHRSRTAGHNGADGAAPAGGAMEEEEVEGEDVDGDGEEEEEEEEEDGLLVEMDEDEDS